MTVFSAQCFPILFRNRWNTTDLADAINGIDMDSLCKEFEELRAAAPSRPDRDKTYFVGHERRRPPKDSGNPSEKHLAIALRRLKMLHARADVTQVRLLDYQFPLKAAQSDRGLGEVDLLGVTAGGRIVIVELKVRRRDDPGDPPVHALMEGLRYAAVVQANIGAIAAEVRCLFAIDVPDRPPIVQILAPEDWWRGWCNMVPRTRRAAGPWEVPFLDLATRVEARLGIAVECASLGAAGLADIAWHAGWPLLPRTPTVSGVALDTW